MSLPVNVNKGKFRLYTKILWPKAKNMSTVCHLLWCNNNRGCTQTFLQLFCRRLKSVNRFHVHRQQESDLNKCNVPRAINAERDYVELELDQRMIMRYRNHTDGDKNLNPWAATKTGTNSNASLSVLPHLLAVCLCRASLQPLSITEERLS